MKIKPVTAAFWLAGFFVAAFSLLSVPVHAEAEPSPADAWNNPGLEEQVDPGETLSSIATVYQTTYSRLYEANLQIEQPDVIHPGEMVRIPAPDEQLADRPLPAKPAAAAVTESTPAPAPVKTSVAPAPQAAAVTTVSSASVWDKLAQCEASGNWAINTGNGFYGGLQFTLSSWQAVGGNGMPHQASRETQIAMGEKLLARQGWGAWPACSSKLGLR